jgi:hypothetical protein
MMMAVSCHQASGDKSPAGQTGVPAAEAQRYVGSYNGSFGKGLITVAINYISGQHVSGYDLHKGLRRNLNGTVSEDSGRVSFLLKEPGDNPFDGIFYLTLDTASLKLNGKWVPLDSAKIATKSMVLSRIGERVSGEAQNDDNIWSGGGDTTLRFNPDGSCEYQMYERPQDSTSQLIRVRGTYQRVADTFKVEWQKNGHTPAQLMKLVEFHTQVPTGENEHYDSVSLRGHGWAFSIQMDD